MQAGGRSLIGSLRITHSRAICLTALALGIGGCPGTTTEPVWQAVTSPAGTTQLRDLWGTSAGDIWAVGPRDRMLRWDGSAWSPVTVATGAMNGMYSVWGASPNAYWAGGDIVGAVLHWNGSSWSQVPTPRPSGTHPDYDQFVIMDLWGFAANDVWAVGEFGKVLHWNGSAWTPANPLRFASATDPTYIESPYGVWGSSPNEVWAVGTHASIWRWNGSNWTRVPNGLSPTNDGLKAVWGTASNDVWAMGDRGLALHWNGSSWTRVPLPSTNHFTAAWGTSATDVWAVGSANMKIFHWTGSQWTEKHNPAGSGLSALWGSSATDIWAVGGAKILRFSPLTF
jgi:hypothetical protein